MDELLEGVGHCGMFQSGLILLLDSCTFCVVWSMMFMAFGAFNPGWTCLDDKVNNTETILIPNQSNNTHLFSPLTSYSSIGNSLLNSTSFTLTIQNTENNNLFNASNLKEESCELYTTCENIVFNSHSSTIVSEWGLICDKSWVPPMMTLIQMLGVMVGAYISGFIGDRFGRWIALYGSMALVTVANFIAIFSTSWQMFTILRFVIGIAMGGVLSCVVVYPAEFIGPFWRACVFAIPTWNIGACAFGIGVLILKDWKHVHIVITVISLMATLGGFWVPESMRWLAVHGNDSKAKRVAYKMARVNNRPLPSLHVLENVAQTEREHYKTNRNYSYTDLFKDSFIRKCSIGMGIVWVFMAVVYYGISFGVQALSGDFYVNFALFSCAELPGMIFVFPAANKLGRRIGGAVYFLLPAVASFLVVPIYFLISNDDLRDNIINAFALIAKMSIVGAWQVNIVFCNELYPTTIRSLSAGYLGAASRIGAMVGPYVFPEQKGLLWITFLILGVMMLTTCVINLIYPETHGVPLADTLNNVSQRNQRQDEDSEFKILKKNVSEELKEVNT